MEVATQRIRWGDLLTRPVVAFAGRQEGRRHGQAQGHAAAGLLIRAPEPRPPRQDLHLDRPLILVALVQPQRGGGFQEEIQGGRLFPQPREERGLRAFLAESPQRGGADLADELVSRQGRRGGGIGVELAEVGDVGEAQARRPGGQQG